jgi:hypothetical protein
VFANNFPQRLNLNKPIDETAAKRKTKGVNAKSIIIKLTFSKTGKCVPNEPNVRNNAGRWTQLIGQPDGWDKLQALRLKK